MNNKITLYIKTLVILALIIFGVFVIFSYIFSISADNTKKLEKPIIAPSQNHTPSYAEKKLKIAFLTDGLFSDAGWGHSDTMQHRHYRENIPI